MYGPLTGSPATSRREMLDMYMTIFVNAIKHPIYKGFVHIYEQSRVFNKSSQYSDSRVLESFQDILRTIIPTWDQKTVAQETNRLRTTSMLHKTLDELYFRIRSLIVMVSMGGSVMDDGDEIRRSVVDSSFETYIHKVYIMAAKDFFIAPMVFYHDAPVESMFDNYQRILSCIDSSIRGVLYVGLPLSDMLNSSQYYMSNKYAEDQAGQLKRTVVDVFSRLPVFQKMPNVPQSDSTTTSAAAASATSNPTNKKTLELNYNPKSSSSEPTSEFEKDASEAMDHLTNTINRNSLRQNASNTKNVSNAKNATNASNASNATSATNSTSATSATSATPPTTPAAKKHGSTRSTNKSITKDGSSKSTKKDKRHHGGNRNRKHKGNPSPKTSPTGTTYSAEFSTSDSAESDASNHSDTFVGLFKRQPLSANQTNDDDVSSAVSHVTFVAKK